MMKTDYFKNLDFEKAALGAILIDYVTLFEAIKFADQRHTATQKEKGNNYPRNEG
jgi:hypothetical protein